MKLAKLKNEQHLNSVKRAEIFILCLFFKLLLSALTIKCESVLVVVM